MIARYSGPIRGSSANWAGPPGASRMMTKLRTVISSIRNTAWIRRRTTYRVSPAFTRGKARASLDVPALAVVPDPERGRLDPANAVTDASVREIERQED